MNVRISPKEDFILKYQSIKNDPTAIKNAIKNVESKIKMAQEGGCIKRPPSIVGPMPKLELQYRMEKDVLEEMLTYLDELKKSHQPKI